MSRLPTPGQDNGTWGSILNDYLAQAHNTDGSLKAGSVGAAQVADNALPATKLDASAQTSLAAVAGKYTKPGTGIPKTDLDATTQASLTKADGSLQASNNLSDVTAGTARTNLGLGTAATMTPATLAADSAFTGAYAVVQKPANAALAANAIPAGIWLPSASTYNVKPTNLKRTRAAAAKAWAGTGLLEIACVGTSLSAGTGAVTKVGSWPSRLHAMLVAKGYPDGGSGFIAAQSNLGATTDARVTLGAGWSAFGASTTNLVQGTSTGGSLTFADTKTSTIVEVYYVDYFTFGFAWTIDGVAQTDVTPTNTGLLRKVTVSGLASATHTVVITPKVGTDGTHPIYIAGVTFKKTSGVVVHNLGVGGMTSGGVVTANSYSPMALLRGGTPANASYAISPNLTFVELGTNDGVGQTASGFQTTVQTLVTAINTLGSDTVLIGEPPTAAARPVAAVLQGAYALADANDVPLVDMSDRLISWSSLDALGLGYDTDALTVHLTDAGYAEMARTVIEGLRL
ncbi:MAG TPA: SGNH/GDSL hydrolase family protein [Candidatus Saccharimonadales bacterium]